MKATTPSKRAFGDFQTPPSLAEAICHFLKEWGSQPQAIVEPTCGTGAFLWAAMAHFPQAQRGLGIEINPTYVQAAAHQLQPYADRVTVREGDFFRLDWGEVLGGLPEPLLVLGNLPWVTNATLGVLGAGNHPEKSNTHRRRGLDALTGKSNFDISEWMLLRLMEALDGRQGTLAILCKTSVARKVLVQAWQAALPIADARLHLIDARAHFGASVDACLLICTLGHAPMPPACEVYPHLAATTPLTTFGLREGTLIANLARHAQWGHLEGTSAYTWRSGLKHDCAPVMELRAVGTAWQNGLGTQVDLEETYLYPLVKSSDLAKAAADRPARRVIVPQRHIGEATEAMAHVAPRTWAYLNRHRARFERRKSSVYRGKPPFSIFGIGAYAFAPWKVAIAGLYKHLSFSVLGPQDGKPVMLDDTCYFVPCATTEEAHWLAECLDSVPARQFFEAYLFWDAKRPITAALLNRLDLQKLAIFLEG